MADRAGVGEVEDPDFLTLTAATAGQSTVAIACCAISYQMMLSIIWEVETFTDAAVADNHHLVAAFDRRDDRIFAILSIYSVRVQLTVLAPFLLM